jgi:hypothetical protein
MLASSGIEASASKSARQPTRSAKSGVESSSISQVCSRTSDASFVVSSLPQAVHSEVARNKPSSLKMVDGVTLVSSSMRSFYGVSAKQ